jgi:pimeloyl-ACP methyl ester carboxylesterase
VQRIAASGGISLACETSGDPAAPPMVLLHGLGERAAGWLPVIPAFAPHFRVFALDMRGHGNSDWPGTYSFQLMCDDVVAVLDGLGLGQVTLVGHSMGGAVALLAAMQQPDRVARLVVEDATPPYPRERAIPGRPDGPLDIDWPVVPAIIGAVNAGDPAAWAGLAAITAPTLLVGGGPRSHIRQDKLAEAAGRIPHGELVTIDAGHNVHADRPAEFAAAVLGWLDLLA